MFEAIKWLVLPNPPLFDAPVGGDALEFLDETYPAETRGMGLPYGENVIIRFVSFTGVTDGRTEIA